MQYTDEWTQRVDDKNGVTCVVIMLRYTQSYGHWKVKNRSFLVFSADDSKTLFTVLE